MGSEIKDAIFEAKHLFSKLTQNGSDKEKFLAQVGLRHLEEVHARIEGHIGEYGESYKRRLTKISRLASFVKESVLPALPADERERGQRLAQLLAGNKRSLAASLVIVSATADGLVKVLSGLSQSLGSLSLLHEVDEKQAATYALLQKQFSIPHLLAFEDLEQVDLVNHLGRARAEFFNLATSLSENSLAARLAKAGDEFGLAFNALFMDDMSTQIADLRRVARTLENVEASFKADYEFVLTRPSGPRRCKATVKLVRQLFQQLANEQS